MRQGIGQVQERALIRPTPEAPMPLPGVATAKEIPYDYVATFILKGDRGNRVQDVINISTEGAFVAVTIGYSFIYAPLPLKDIEAKKEETKEFKNKFSNIPLKDWMDKNKRWKAIITDFGGKSTIETLALLRPILDLRSLSSCFLARFCGINFKYSIIDSGTGRELQNKPIHNISGLGKADGDRPFRPLAKPMLFIPNSTIRIEVEEISEGWIYEGAQLFIVLHGYKILGYGRALP
jgi:hypothetical protein